MSEVYGNAFVTIAATSAKDGEEGFLHERKHVKLHRNLYIRSAYEYDQSFETSKLFSRAWCYQEVMLTERILSFERSNVSFACRLSYHHDDQNILWASPVLRRGSALETIRALSRNPQDEAEEREAHRMSQEIVSLYSRRGLTFHKDKLPALAGMASRMGNAAGDRYLAGLWESNLLNGLRWRPWRGTCKSVMNKRKNTEARLGCGLLGWEPRTTSRYLRLVI